MQQTALFDRPVSAHDHGCKVLIRIPVNWQVTAEFDGPDDCYRYSLMHRWGPGPLALIGMKNPSGASLRIGDQTVMKTSRIFKRLGFGAQVVVNACAYRHVNPAALLDLADPVGPGNLAAIRRMAAEAELIVIGHGRLPGALQRHAHAMCEALQDGGRQLHVLRLTPDGVPMHPLARGAGHIPEDTIPMPWRYTCQN